MTVGDRLDVIALAEDGDAPTPAAGRRAWRRPAPRSPRSGGRDRRDARGHRARADADANANANANALRRADVVPIGLGR